MKIMNEISKSKVEQEKINEIGSKLETLNDYQQKTNNSKSVENIRLDVNGMIDQFGAL